MKIQTAQTALAAAFIALLFGAARLEAQDIQNGGISGVLSGFAHALERMNRGSDAAGNTDESLTWQETGGSVIRLSFNNYRFYNMKSENPVVPVIMNGSVELNKDHAELDGRLSTANSGSVRNIEFRKYKIYDDNEPGIFRVNNIAIDNEVFYEFMDDAEDASQDIVDAEMEVAALFYAIFLPMDELEWDDGTELMPASRDGLPAPGTRVSNDERTVTVEAKRDGVIEYFTSYRSKAAWADMAPVINGNVSVSFGYNNDSVDSMTFDGTLTIGNLPLISTLEFVSCSFTSLGNSEGRLTINGKTYSFTVFMNMMMRS